MAKGGGGMQQITPGGMSARPPGVMPGAGGPPPLPGAGTGGMGGMGGDTQDSINKSYALAQAIMQSRGGAYGGNAASTRAQGRMMQQLSALAGGGGQGGGLQTGLPPGIAQPGMTLTKGGGNQNAFSPEPAKWSPGGGGGGSNVARGLLAQLMANQGRGGFNRGERGGTGYSTSRSYGGGPVGGGSGSSSRAGRI